MSKSISIELEETPKSDFPKITKNKKKFTHDGLSSLIITLNMFSFQCSIPPARIMFYTRKESEKYLY